MLWLVIIVDFHVGIFGVVHLEGRLNVHWNAIIFFWFQFIKLKDDDVSLQLKSLYSHRLLFLLQNSKLNSESRKGMKEHNWTYDERFETLFIGLVTGNEG